MQWQGLETCKADPDSINEGLLSQTTCGSKSWTRGSYLALTVVIVYSVYYPRLLGLSTVESVLFCLENFVWILRLPLYLILSNEGWGWCLVNTVCAVCVCAFS